MSFSNPIPKSHLQRSPQTARHFISAQFYNPPVLRADLTGKTVLVIGASTGIGLEAAKHFASMNTERIIIACRNEERGLKAAEEIKGATGHKNVEVWLLDLVDFASVRAFAERFENDGGRLDVVVANAGMAPVLGQPFTKDGWEESFQTNNLSTHLLSILLLPKLLETARKYNTTPRLVIVSSGGQTLAYVKPRYLEAENPTLLFGKEQPIDGGDLESWYFVTKLFNVLFATTLSSLLVAKGQRVIVNSVDPGYCYSNFRSKYVGWRKWIDKVREVFFARSAEQGSRQLIWASIAGTPLEGSSEEKGLGGVTEDEIKGSFVAGTTLLQPAELVVSEKEEYKVFRERLWSTFLDELIAIEPKVKEIAGEYFP